MTDCYRFIEDVSEIPGNFDRCINCMYVLLMEGSDREAQIREHVAQAGITSKVVYQYNKGYKKCKKKMLKQSTNYDLEHALKNVFRDALARGYKRIIVLEDDCEFDERIRDSYIVNDICTFLVNKNPEIYSLGSNFPVVNPVNILFGSRHQLMLINGGTHAMIYNQKYMEKLLKTDALLGHVDVETNRHLSKFTYHVPMAYQKMIMTENVRNSWSSFYTLMNTLIWKPLGMDTRVQPGYDNIKKWFETFVVIIFFIMILCYVS